MEYVIFYVLRCYEIFIKNNRKYLHILLTKSLKKPKFLKRRAVVVELVDTLAWGASGESCAGSSPVDRTQK